MHKHESYQEVLDAIEENSHGIGVLLDDDGRYCIVGYLLHRLGEKDAMLQNRSMFTLCQCDKITRSYPFIESRRLSLLIDVNDSNNTLTGRRAALRALVRSWELVDQIAGNGY